MLGADDEATGGGDGESDAIASPLALRSSPTSTVRTVVNGVDDEKPAAGRLGAVKVRGGKLLPKERRPVKSFGTQSKLVCPHGGALTRLCVTVRKPV